MVKKMTERPIQKSRTRDGKTLEMWFDGTLTFAFGFKIPGIGKPRSKHHQLRDSRIAHWIIDSAPMYYDAGEIARVFNAARRWLSASGSMQSGELGLRYAVARELHTDNRSWESLGIPERVGNLGLDKMVVFESMSKDDDLELYRSLMSEGLDSVAQNLVDEIYLEILSPWSWIES